MAARAVRLEDFFAGSSLGLAAAIAAGCGFLTALGCGGILLERRSANAAKQQNRQEREKNEIALHFFLSGQSGKIKR